jgi:hypothetical protein
LGHPFALGGGGGVAHILPVAHLKPIAQLFGAKAHLEPSDLALIAVAEIKGRFSSGFQCRIWQQHLWVNIQFVSLSGHSIVPSLVAVFPDNPCAGKQAPPLNRPGDQGKARKLLSARWSPQLPTFGRRNEIRGAGM